LTPPSPLPTIRGERIGVITIAKVLLTSTVENLGHVGEVVEVADGYARNYLFPRGLAIEPTEHNIARFAKERKAHEAELLEREEKARYIRDRLADQTLKAHDDDRLYGSVRSEDIAAKIEELVGPRISPRRSRSSSGSISSRRRSGWNGRSRPSARIR